jgi:hypothetical protein
MGAINGLLFGGVAEAARQLYNEYEHRAIVAEFTRRGVDGWPHTADMLRWQFIPAVCFVLFSVGSLLIHRYWVRRPKSLVLLWQVIGVACVTAFFLVEAVTTQRGIQRLAFNWLFALALVLVTNTIYGAALKMIGAYYAQIKKSELP